MELVKSTIEHREPNIVGFFILQYAKLRMLKLFYNFFDQLCDFNHFEELETDTYSLYVALAEEDLDERILPSKRAKCSDKRSKDCQDSFTMDAKNKFSPLASCSKHNKHDKREQGLFKEETRCNKMLCLCGKIIAVTKLKVDSISIAVKEWD